VTGLRRKIAALALVAGILAATGGSVFALDRHAACAAKQHDCGTSATISSCCCGDQGAVLNETTAAQPRVEIQAGLSAVPAFPHIIHVAPTPQALSAVQTSPPRLCLLDLPTLFATLLL
jgi:hypothetical protein